MLQQTVIKAVLPVYQRFLHRFPDVTSLAGAHEDEVRQAVRGLGYYRRFAFMHRAAKMLVDAAGNGPIPWPTSAEEWRSLPGIGEYTGAAIASITLGEAVPVVDGNVERVLCRLLDLRVAPNLPGLKPFFKEWAGELLETKAPGDFNQALMELGQLVCTKANPSCEDCPVSANCLAFARGSQAEAPQTKDKPEAKDVSLRLVIVKRHGKVALFKRPQDARFLKGTWGFLTAFANPGELCADGSGLPNITTSKAQDLGQVRHNITQHRITARVAFSEDGHSHLGDARWYPPAVVEENLVSNLDRKAWHLLMRMS